MNLWAKLCARADRPVRVGLVGAGKFGAMYLAQARRTPGLHVMAVADLSLDRALVECLLNFPQWRPDQKGNFQRTAALRPKREIFDGSKC